MQGARKFNTGVSFSAQTITISASTYTIDWSLSSKWIVTLSSNVTLTFTAPIDASNLVMEVIQDSTGSRIITWPTILWPSATAPTLSTTVNRKDLVTFFYDGTNYLGLFTPYFA